MFKHLERTSSTGEKNKMIDELQNTLSENDIVTVWLASGGEIDIEEEDVTFHEDENKIEVDLEDSMGFVNAEMIEAFWTPETPS